jgi:antitoxin component of MazEF toxin-antitoxin module
MAEYSLERRVIQMGRSLVVTLPAVWARAKRLAKGDRVLVKFDSYEYLKLMPARDNCEKKKEGQR